MKDTRRLKLILVLITVPATVYAGVKAFAERPFDMFDVVAFGVWLAIAIICIIMFNAEANRH